MKGLRGEGKAGKIDQLGRLIRDGAHCRIALSEEKLASFAAISFPEMPV